MALLLVMWALFILSFSIIGLLALLKIDIGNASGMERVALASSLAFSGITLGRHADFPLNSKPETLAFPDGGKLEVRVVSENGKLHVNKLLGSGKRGTLLELFRIWGLSDTEANTVLDCLLDYVEPGANRRLNGAKAPQYRAAGRAAPPGRSFLSIDEMKNVLNFDLVTNRRENWRDYFTIYGDGTLDLTAAEPDVIRAVCHVGEASANAVYQSGSDLKDMESVRAAMGLTSKEFEGLQDRLSLGGNTRRIHATGTFAQAKRTIEAIYQINGSASALLDWREW